MFTLELQKVEKMGKPQVTKLDASEIPFKSVSEELWRPQGDSNPCCRRERAVS